MRRRKVPTAQAKKGMVASASVQASKIGAKILAQGGNAFDAAVAVSFALGVAEGHASGIGGQTLALVFHAESKRFFALDGSSFAPFHFQPKDIPNSPKKLGLSASTLPSTVAFYGYLHERYGSLDFGNLLMPAIRLAEKGYVLGGLQQSLIEKHKKELMKDEGIKKAFFHSSEPLPKGERIIQKDLSRCMRLLARNGWKDFYEGEVKEEIVKDMKERNGLLREEDFAQIPTPIEREVLAGRYRRYGIVTFPPPGAGRVLVQIMNILEQFPPASIDPATPLGNLVLALSFELTLKDRRRMPKNPEIYAQLMKRKMLDKEHAARVKETIDAVIASLAEEEEEFRLRTVGETTHFSIADDEGNIIAVTQSIEKVFGAKSMAKGLGFFYNNYMSAYEYKDKTHPYYLLPRNRPWSSVAPTIVTHRKRPILVLGSPGSERIATTLAQVLVRYLDKEESLGDAIGAPRFHTSEEKKLQIEAPRYAKEVIEMFRSTGFSVKARDPYSFQLGCVQAIELPGMKNRRRFTGVADPRRQGGAKGADGK